MAQTTKELVLPAEAVQVALDAVAEILGISGIRSVLQHVGFEEYLTSDTVKVDLPVTFEQIGIVTEAFIDIYGERGARAILKRAGRIQFEKWREAYPSALNAANLALKTLPPNGRVKATLNAVKFAAKHIVGVETDVQEREGVIYFAVFQCPYCAGVQADKPFCLTAVGAIEAVTLWATGERWRVREVSCLATGSSACVFQIELP